jgi:hypothetical protein
VDLLWTSEFCLTSKRPLDSCQTEEDRADWNNLRLLG